MKIMKNSIQNKREFLSEQMLYQCRGGYQPWLLAWLAEQAAKLEEKIMNFLIPD
jgi:hypothetical protein